MVPYMCHFNRLYFMYWLMNFADIWITSQKKTATFCSTNGYCQILFTFWAIWCQNFDNFILGHRNLKWDNAKTNHKFLIPSTYAWRIFCSRFCVKFCMHHEKENIFQYLNWDSNKQSATSGALFVDFKVLINRL